MYDNDSRSYIAAFWTIDLRPSNILTMISWGRNFAHIWFYLPTVQVWVGKIFAFRAYNFIKSSNSLTGMFIDDHVANTDIFMWFHGKIDQKIKVEKSCQKSVILCNLSFWIEVHFYLYLKNQLANLLLLYLVWKLFL